MCLAVKQVGKPGAGNRHARFDEPGMGNGALAIGPKLPRPSSHSTEAEVEDLSIDILIPAAAVVS